MYLKKMVLYSVWPNCNNNCKFCLRKERDFHDLQWQIENIESIRRNLRHIDWKTEFSSGVSLLGGELYNIEDSTLKYKFILLIDDIIELVLKRSDNPNVKLSTVTNGIYDPLFLFSVIDKVKNSVGMKYVDVNFSYDIKYRYKSDEDERLVLKNISEFSKRYDYKTGVQMVLTQYVIDRYMNGSFNISEFQNISAPGSILTFLYPHKIQTGMKIDDFFFTRRSFLAFVQRFRLEYPENCLNFMYSVKNSAIFKYTGNLLRGKDNIYGDSQLPILSDGKEDINQTCMHSTLYLCYSDSDKCLLCDLEVLEPEIMQ